MMNHWNYVALGDVCTVERGGSPRPIDDFITTESDGINWIKIGDTDESMYITKTAQKIKPEGMKKSRYVKPGDFLLSNSMSFGRPYILKIDGCIHDGWLVLRDENNVFDKKFLYYYLSAPITYEKFKSMAVGGVVNNLNSDMVRKIRVPLPSKQEQRDITDSLDKITNLHFLRKQQLAKLDELIKARFVEMFGEPSSNPMGWLQTTVGAECYYIKDGPHKSLTDVGMENGYPFISVRNIVNGYIDFSTAKYISEADYKDAIKKCCPEKGDILYSKGGTTGIAKLVDIDIKFANWVHLAVLKFNHNEFNGSFFEKMLNCDYCYKQSQMLTKGIANRDLVLSAMAQIKIYKPPILLQNQFAAFVERVDQQKQTVQQSLEKLELMKKALMQEYFG